MSSELWQRIKASRKAAGLTQEELGKVCDPPVSRAAVAQWESEDSNQRNNPKLSNLLTISEVTGVDLKYLLSDSYDISDEYMKKIMEDDESPINPSQTNNKALARIPLIELQQAGAWEEAINLPGTGEVNLTENNYDIEFAVKLDSNSLEPKYKDGDVFLVSTKRSPAHKNLVVAEIGGDYVVRQYWREAGEIELKPINTDYKPHPIEKCKIVGVVIGKYDLEILI